MPAKTTKKFFSRETEVAIDIHADPEAVWAVLLNAAEYPKWSSTVTSLDGRIALGETIELKSVLDGKRTYLVTRQDPSTVTFSMRERIGGQLFTFFAGKIPSFDETFDKFAADLK